MSQPPAEPPRPRHDLGVLLVHGIGVQRRGETLADFGEPIVEWLKQWCAGLHERWVNALLVTAKRSPDQPEAVDLQAVLEALETRQPSSEEDRRSIAWAIEAVHELLDDLDGTEPSPKLGAKAATKVLDEPHRFAPGVLAAGVELVDGQRETANDPEAPAHARLIIRRLGFDGLASESWLVAESWWADTFWPPKFSDLGRWVVGIVPWTLGSHYGSGVRRVWRQRPAAGAMNRARWAGRLTASVLRLLASLPLALLALLALGLLLLVAAIPIPRLREALGTLQRQLAAVVGDSFILVTRPIEAASMVGQVRRDAAWLAAAVGGGDLAVLAHSQGAAMAYDALSEAPPPNLRLLLTFGSGMRKLEELRNLLGRGGYLQKAMGLTLAGLVAGALYGWFVFRAAFGRLGDAAAARDAAAAVHEVFEVLMTVPFALGGLVLVAAGLWDLLEGMDLAALRRKIDRFARWGVRWVDCFATKDPVPNGPLLDDGPAAEIEVCNESSTTADHTAYWRNRDEMVSLVVAELTTIGGRERLLTPRPAWGDALAPRRRWRVRWLAAVRALAWTAIALAIVARWSVWRPLIAWGLQRAEGWLANLIGLAAAETKVAVALGHGRAVAGALLLALVPAVGARAVWRYWNAAEMRAAIRGGPSQGIPAWPLVAVCGQLACAVWIASMADRLRWLPLGVVAAGVVTLSWLIATQPSPEPPAPIVVAPATQSAAGCAWKLVLGLASIYFVLLSWLEPAVVAWTTASWWKLAGLLLVAAVVGGLMLAGSLKRRKP